MPIRMRDRRGGHTHASRSWTGRITIVVKLIGVLLSRQGLAIIRLIVELVTAVLILRRDVVILVVALRLGRIVRRWVVHVVLAALALRPLFVLPALSLCFFQESLAVVSFLALAKVFDLVLPDQRARRISEDALVLAELADPDVFA